MRKKKKFKEEKKKRANDSQRGVVFLRCIQAGQVLLINMYRIRKNGKLDGMKRNVIRPSDELSSSAVCNNGSIVNQKLYRRKPAAPSFVIYEGPIKISAVSVPATQLYVTREGRPWISPEHDWKEELAGILTHRERRSSQG